MQGTIEAIRSRLTSDGFVRRYATEPAVDGLPPGEAAFLPCSFWLVDCLALAGRMDEAERACSSGCWQSATTWACWPKSTTPERRRQVGNFPQAFSHVALVNTIYNLHRGCRRSGAHPRTRVIAPDRPDVTRRRRRRS